jgi:peptidoglycan hydrolase CwlO-like protein
MTDARRMPGARSHRGRNLLVDIIVAAVLIALAPPARAASLSQLREAKSKMATLTARIQVEERSVARTEGHLHELNDEIGRTSTRVVRVQERARLARRKLLSLHERLHQLQNQMNALASSAYIDQPGGQLGTVLSVMLGSQSLSSLWDGIEFVARVSDAANVLAQQMASAERAVSSKLASLHRLAKQRSELLAELTSERARLDELDAEQHRALDQLNQTRSQVIGLVHSLERKLATRLFPIVGTAFQGDAHTSYGRWAVLFLRTLGAPTCHANEVAVVAWQLAEFTQAAWNPLATTKSMPGSSAFNAAGVQDFASLAAGLEASKLTLYEGASSYRYGPILDSLRQCAGPYTTADAIRSSAWCYECADGRYVVDKIAEVSTNFDEYASF